MAGSLLHDAALAPVWDALPGSRVVGGAVRDTLAGVAVADIDLATPMPPDAVLQALKGAGLRAMPTGIAHGTVTAVSGGRTFEVTTLRRDLTTDGRHATVAFTDDWQEDAARRDFTINAMSMDRGGAVFDYFGGVADLRSGTVRFVGDPTTRIAEDFLRVLRFFRFFARYGSDGPDPPTRVALAASLSGLSTLSPERVWSELKRILSAANPDRALALMQQLGVTGAILPELPIPARPVAALPPDPVLRLAALSPSNPTALARRLRVSTAERDRLAALLAPALAEDVSDVDLARALADTPAQILADRARIAGRTRLVARILSAPTPVFPLQGRDLLAAGMAPGPELGAMLADLRDVWLSSGCTAQVAQLEAELAGRLRR